MIAPIWQNQTWYPTLLQMQMSFPFFLLETQHILTSPREEHHPMAMEGHLPLAAWPNQGVVPQQRTFRRGYQDAQQVLEELNRVSIYFSLETVESPSYFSASDILDFLLEQFDAGKQYRAINTVRSATSMTQ